VDAWEHLIIGLAKKMGRPSNFPALVWRSGMSHDVADLITQMMKAASIPLESIEIFSMGRASEAVPDDIFAEWLDILTDARSFRVAATALNLASMSVLGGRKLTAGQLKRVLTQPALLEQKSDRSDPRLSHYWLHLARELIRIDASAEQLVLRSLVENVANSGAVAGSLGPEGEKYLDQLVAKNPADTWRILSPYITPPMDVRGFVTSRWLRGHLGFDDDKPGPMRHIPREEIWAWVEADPEARAAYLATMAPKDFTTKTWQGSLIRDILVRFGDSDKVQSAVFANFFTGGWAGSASAHYAAEKQSLEHLKSAESHPDALRWLNTAIESVTKQMEAARIEEEARGF
jgi:hypothetical protein